MRFGETLAKFNVPEKEQKDLAGRSRRWRS